MPNLKQNTDLRYQIGSDVSTENPDNDCIIAFLYFKDAPIGNLILLNNIIYFESDEYSKIENLLLDDYLLLIYEAKQDLLSEENP